MLNNKEKTKLLKDICNKEGLYPIVPLTSYSKTPYCQWNDEKYQLDVIQLIGSKTNWTNKEGKDKQGNITGYTLVTGMKSGIMVLDIDNKNNINGYKTLMNLCNDLEIDTESLFKTMTIKTPSGGYHLYFKYKEGLKNKANLFEGLDIRTDGGIIVLPYTTIRKDNKNLMYEIKSSNEILEMPEKLFNRLLEFCNNRHNKETNIKREKLNSYEDLENKKIGQGKRNDDMISKLGSWIKYPNMRDKAVLMELGYAYTQTYHTPSMKKDELERTIVSALNYALPKYCNKKGRVVIADLVDHVKKTNSIYTRGYSVHIYNEEKGVYQKFRDEQIKNQYLDCCCDSLDKTTTKAEEYTKMLQLRTMDSEVEDTKRYINLLNGVYDLEQEKLLTHSPKYKTSVQIKGRYDLEKFNEKWENSVLKKVIGQIFFKNLDVIPTVYKMIGLTLSPHAKEVSKVFLLVGCGSNGKSTICNLIKALHGGVEFISSLGIADFEKQFAPSSLEGKLVNINPDDNSTRINQTGNFKRVASGESITIEKKGKDQRDIESNITIILGFNTMPTSSDTTHGFYRRNCVIPFNTTFGNKEDLNADFIKDNNVESYIINNEMDLLVTLAIESLRELKKDNWILKESQSIKDALEEHKLNTDIGYMFLKEKIEVNNDLKAFVSSKDMYDFYKKWCYINDFTPMSQGRLTNSLKSNGLSKLYTNKGGNDRNKRGFKGIWLRG